MMPTRGMHMGGLPGAMATSGDATIKTLAGEGSIGGSGMEEAARKMKQDSALAVATGGGVDIEAMKIAVDGVDLSRLEALKRAAK